MRKAFAYSQIKFWRHLSLVKEIHCFRQSLYEVDKEYRTRSRNHKFFIETSMQA